MSHSIVHRANGILLAVLVAILLLVGGATWDQINLARAARAWSAHAETVVSTIKDLNLELRNAETGQRGYLLTGRDDYLQPYRVAVGRISELQVALQRLAGDNQAELIQLRSLSPIVQRKLAELGETVQLRRTAGLEPALALVRTDVGRNQMKQIEASLASMSLQEQALLAQRLQIADRHSHRVRVLMLSGIVVALTGLLWSARMLNHAWSHSWRLEVEQRTGALKLRACLDSLTQGVAVFDADRNLENWNDCFHELLDLPRATFRAGTPYSLIEAATRRDGEVSLLEAEAQISQERLQSGEPTMYLRTRGKGQELELRRSPMPGGGFVLTVTNMTKRAQSEALMREAQKMQAVGQLTGGIAHDFNNLLTVILGNLEMIYTKFSGEQVVQTRIERATWAAQRGAALTAQLLAFARKQPLAPVVIDLAAAIPDMVPVLRHMLGAGIEIDVTIDPELWSAVADPTQLERALLNMVANAREAMPAGGSVSIALENAVLDADYARSRHEVVPGEYVMLAISDSGCGMAPEVVARAFEPFFTTKPDGGGTGLGLAMVFGFVRQSGGHVRIDSQPGEGTTLRIYLPRLRGVAEPSVAPDAEADGPASGAVLLVEDEPGVREIAIEILADLGYHVLEAADGEAGLRMFGAHMMSIELLLIDLVLPGRISGHDLARRIVAMQPKVKVLFMSGHSERAMLQHERLESDAPVLLKPFTRDELARRMTQMMGAGSRSGAVVGSGRRVA